MQKTNAFALAALIAAAFTALVSVSRADFMGSWYINGNQTQAWTSTSGGDGKGLRTVTGQLCAGYSTPGTLNQDAGTITVTNPTWETIIGQYAYGTYHMSDSISILRPNPRNPLICGCLRQSYPTLCLISVVMIVSNLTKPLPPCRRRSLSENGSCL